MMLWVPGPGFVESVARAGLATTADVYAADGVPPGLAAEVEFYVPVHPFRANGLDLLEEMSGLRVLQVLSSGVDHVLPRVPGGVVVCNAPVLHARATAETAMSLILASLNHVSAWVDGQRHGVWRDPGPRAGLAGKTVLIVGYGSVGRALAAMLAGFGVRVIPVARRRRDGVAGIESLSELVGVADVVVVAAPLTEATRGMFGRENLRRLRDGALLVNVSRGPLVDTDALVEQVSSGRIRAALDVTNPEPLPQGHPLWMCPGVLISPHVGGNMVDFEDRAVVFVAEQVSRYLGGRPLLNVVRRP